jgi:hypothetical protein
MSAMTVPQGVLHFPLREWTLSGYHFRHHNQILASLHGWKTAIKRIETKTKPTTLGENPEAFS